MQRDERTDADDADLLSGTAAIALQGRVDGDAGALQRACVLEFDLVRQVEDPVLAHADRAGVAAVSRALAVRVLGVVRVDHLDACEVRRVTGGSDVQ